MEIDLYQNKGVSGPIILWLDYGCYDGWQPYSFETVADALHVNKLSYPYIITRKADYAVTEI